MSENQLRAKLKGVYTIAMVNVIFWAVALIALTILLQKGGNLRGLFVILAGGIGIGIQLVASISKRRKQ